MNYREKWYQQISLFKFVKRFVKEGGYKRGSKKRKKKKRPIRGWYPMAAASWMRIASRGGVSYRRIISATEARRAFSPIFAAVPSPSLFISRVYFLQRTDPFVYPPSPRCSDNDGSPPPPSIFHPFLLECSFFLLESLWLLTLRSDCFLGEK